jgi:hypothetical protein
MASGLVCAVLIQKKNESISLSESMFNSAIEFASLPPIENRAADSDEGAVYTILFGATTWSDIEPEAVRVLTAPHFGFPMSCSPLPNQAIRGHLPSLPCTYFNSPRLALGNFHGRCLNRYARC